MKDPDTLITEYQKAGDYILGIPKFAGKNSPEDTGALLALLCGDAFAPERADGPKIIHIAGTNGKGSTSAYLSSILMEAGYKTGLFTSPHLSSLRERIRINGEMIGREDFVSAFRAVLRATQEAKEKGIASHPSYFEFLFLMAMWYFAKKGAGYLVLETGLGGRLDATNSIEKKDLCVLTNIDYDHTEYLGDTIEKIAYEKAGILMKGVPVVFDRSSSEAAGVIEKRAAELNCRCYGLKPEDISLSTVNKEGIDFCLSCEYYRSVTLKIKQIAAYQAKNAALAALGAHILADPKIGDEEIRKGLLSAQWPGRFEEILPGLILDGAHNPDGIRAFLSSVKALPCEGRRTLIFGVVSDKRYEEMAGLILESGLFDEIDLVPVEGPRGLSTKALEKAFSGAGGPSIKVFDNAKEAVSDCLLRRGGNDSVYAAGSLYLIGELRSAFGKE
ncbi:MAG: bifunctional folylpolyglutamate synthase/dihydrofolate synthase [Lachnospiraceae bacterium]|nr:bifunctional folylpolyglutamate synthase/dihydrofolate synthase [Lachnospiraceae bacterium]